MTSSLKLWIRSDEHFEQGNTLPLPPDHDVLVYAGDCNRLSWVASTLDRSRGRFGVREQIYVPGNHDYYGVPSIEWERRYAAPLFAEAGIRLLDPGVAVIGGVRFVGATLWTDYALMGDRMAAMKLAAEGISDHRRIMTEKLIPGHGVYTPTPGSIVEERRRMAVQMSLHRFGEEPEPYDAPLNAFSPAQAWRRHAHEVAFLGAELSKPFDGETVLITHHSPSALSVPERFRDDPYSPCFHSALSLVERHQPFLATHGHIHDPMDYTIGRTRVICNPAGYQREPYRGFQGDLVVEVPVHEPAPRLTNP